jgi:hypothetical protein
MAYINTATNEYPFFEADKQYADDPDVYVEVQWVDPPPCDLTTQVPRELPPSNEGDGWHMNWEIHTYTDEERAANIAAQAAMLKALEPPNPPNVAIPGSAPDVL